MTAVNSSRFSGGDVNDPAAEGLLADLDDLGHDLPREARDIVERWRRLIAEDHAAWKRRHEESIEADDAAEVLAEAQRNLAEKGFDVDLHSGDLDVTPALLARHVAALAPWERQTFSRLLAEETGDAWRRSA